MTKFLNEELRTLSTGSQMKALFCLNVEFPVNRWRWPGSAEV
jgi:hypothetical protein